MNANDLRYFKKKLLDERDAILRIEKVVDSAVASVAAGSDEPKYATHLADLGSDTLSKEHKSYFDARLRKYLGHINEAMARIENGTYGLCVVCGKKILKARMQAVPHTRYCVQCKLQLAD